MIDASDLIKESKRGGKGATPFDDEDMASPDKRQPVLSNVVNERMRQNLLAGVEELIDRNATTFEIDKNEWHINKASNQRMVYIPKDAVTEFMKKIELESNKRIARYRDYAQGMKNKFQEYEIQSERYYADMLEKFKAQAREVVQKKHKELEIATKQRDDHAAKVMRIKERIKSKATKRLLSDEEDQESEEETPVLKVDMVEYNYASAERQKTRLVIEQWVRQFKEKYDRNPTDADTQAIALQLADYENAEKSYLNLKLKMMEQSMLPFDVKEFQSSQTQAGGDLSQKASQFRQTLSQGFGGASSNKSNDLQAKCDELQKEITELRRILQNGDTTGQVQQLIKQLMGKDILIEQRDKKLDTVAKQNNLLQDEKKQLKAKLEEGGQQQLLSQAQNLSFIGNDPANAEIMRISMQNKDLMFQIAALNKINALFLAKAKLGNKNLTPEELRKLEEDVQESQEKMLESYTELNEQQSRQISQLQKDLQNSKLSGINLDSEQGTATLKQMKELIDKMVEAEKQMKTKIEVLEAEKSTSTSQFQAQLKKVQDEFAEITEASVVENQKLTQRVAQLELELSKGIANQTSKQTGAELERKREFEAIKDAHEKEIKKNTAQIKKLEKQVEELEQKSGTSSKELQDLQERLKKSLEENDFMTRKLEKFSIAANEAATLKEKCSVYKQHLKEATAELEIVSTKYKEEQVKRKQLLNELEDLKGKVRVYARVRPFSKTEKKDPERAVPCFQIPDEVSLSIGVDRNRIKDYQFDSVFGPDSTQEQVFDETKRLIQSAIDGYNVCIFAYGQTGSGKTFTIQGSPEMPGLTPRAIVEMFEILKTMSNFDIKLKCYMVELYLDSLRDLLKPKKEEEKVLDIKESANGMVVIHGVTEVELNSISQTEQIFEDGLAGRKTRKTNMNDASSRSHLIFSIIVDSTNVNTNVRTIGKLSFVDLAGSEKSSKTGTDAEGQAEANAINMSLSALGNVISALSEGAKFIPYRNHILTKLMKDSLGGTAKTLMFVNCSPSVYNESETKNSLDYATRVKKIKNNVNKNVESKEMQRTKEALGQAEDLVDRLKSLLLASDKAGEAQQLLDSLKKAE